MYCVSRKQGKCKSKGKNGETPLLIAVQNGHTDVCTLLIKTNANVNEKRGDGVTPLLMAVQNGLSDVCTMLLGKNSNVNEK